GFCSHGFPNLFHMGGVQSGVSPNFTELYNEQSRHVAYVIGAAEAAGARTVEPTAEAEAEWVAVITASAGSRAEFQESCTPGYYNNEGQPISESDMFNGSGHPGGPVAFFEFLDAWRQTGAFAGLSFS
ncbi:MAG: monooxygenase, partial [Actinomycetota bacterium]